MIARNPFIPKLTLLESCETLRKYAEHLGEEAQTSRSLTEAEKASVAVEVRNIARQIGAIAQRLTKPRQAPSTARQIESSADLLAWLRRR